jgi:hypothetical protein
MKIRIEDGLPYVTATITYRGREMTIEKGLLDTGSMGTVFSSDKVEKVHLLAEPTDEIRQIYGVGGREFVFTKKVDRLAVGDLRIQEFAIEVGAMSYGLDIEAIIGLDFLTQTGAVIDLSKLQVLPATY